MAAGLARCSSSLIASPAFLRRRLPLVGAFCMLTLGLTNLNSLGCALSLPFNPFLRSKFSRQITNKGIHSCAMESSSNTVVPSIVVYVTVPNTESGKKLAASIVKEKLAACVNRVPGIESVYEWKGEIQTDSEELLIIKTRESLLNPLTEHIKANHEYDLPEVIALPILGGNLPYLEWIKNSTRD
ncbi:Divalent-cation tolerance protein cuta [Thalictrum thalictroides]|uniref:Divalent-cation tolerance protein cuta n=1 Tax=Thalictrum thalictroides TaxID=46969 RepID=A0A7J6VMV9_THATH|nr:Divalent-cation tolerance protein cuta [Thalictrum thalictroides]